MSGGYPLGYHLTLLRGDDGTPFADPAEQERVWGREWGAADEVGRLRMVLVRRPRGEFGAVRADCWDDDSGALVDPDGLWYWEERTPPDLRAGGRPARGAGGGARRRGRRGGRGGGRSARAHHDADLHARPADHGAGRGHHRAAGAVQAPRRGGAGDADGVGAGDADPGHDPRARADGGRQLRQADAGGGRVRDVVSLQRRGRPAAGGGAAAARDRADRGAAVALLDPHRRAHRA